VHQPTSQKGQLLHQGRGNPIPHGDAHGLATLLFYGGRSHHGPLCGFRFSVCFSCVDQQQYAISAALIASGICSLINVSKLPIPFTERCFGRQLYLGSGVLSVLGTSFTFLPIFEIGISQQIEDGVDPQVAYGRMIGTSMLLGLSEM
jgi:uric acid-xanthine permease